MRDLDYIFILIVLIAIFFCTTAFLRVKIRTLKRNLDEANRSKEETLKKLQAKTVLNETVSKKMKGEFLASMSHEIRNPLNGLLGVSRILMDGNPRPPEHIKHLSKCASRLNYILEELLDYSSFQAGTLNLQSQPFDVNELIEDVVDTFRHEAAEKNLPIKTNLPKVDKLWVGDATLLKHSLSNLISNAVKYTLMGEIDVSLEFEEMSENTISAKFIIQDTGPGIENTPNLNPSSKSENTLIARQSGLGLQITNDFSKFMGGSLELDASNAEGTRFIIYLDLKKSKTATNLKLPSIELSKQKSLVGKTVLIADDMEFNRYINQQILHRMGAKTILVADGESALRELKNQIIDLAIIDINMPKLSGLEVIKEFRKSTSQTQTRLIALSGHSTKEMESRCLEVGFDHFIEKPLEPHKIELIYSGLKPKKQRLQSESMLSYLAKNNPDSIQKLKERFNKSMKQEFTKLKASILDQQFEDAKKSNHKLKGLVSFYKDPEVIQILDKISNSIQHSENVNDFKSDLAAFDAALNKMVDSDADSDGSAPS